MLQLKPETPDLWDSILPEELRKLPEELARVDILLQDERLIRGARVVIRRMAGRAP